MENMEKYPVRQKMIWVKQSFMDGGLKMWAALSQSEAEDSTAYVDLWFF